MSSIVVCAATLHGASNDASARAGLAQRLGNLPAGFEANVGQTDSSVKFLSRGRGYELFLTSNKAVLTVHQDGRGKAAAKGDWLNIVLRGANSKAKIGGAEELPGKANYFVGNDPRQWRTNVPTYAKVKYEEVYPGVDLVYYGNQRHLEYDFVVKPGGSPIAIAFNLDNSFGKHVAAKIDAAGDLVIPVADGKMKMHKPVVYQTVGGERAPVSGRYLLARDGAVRFEVADYDHSKPLVIDPVLSYSTYLGGSSEEDGGFEIFEAPAITVDGSGNAYVTATTFSSDFPTANAFQPSLKGRANVFVSKIAANGSSLVYSTYLGGDCQDNGVAIAVDNTGSAYVTGQTCSSNFPTKSAFQTDSKPLFVTRLNADGNGLLYSTYFGGNLDGGSQSNAIAVDNTGNAYIAGLQFSRTFPATHDFQAGDNVGPFVAKFNTNKSGSESLIYSTLFGGSKPFGSTPGPDLAFALAVDAAGNAYVGGLAMNTDFPSVNALQPTMGGFVDAFITKFNPDGSAILYSTFLGGENAELVRAIAVDSEGNAYVAGDTNSPDFPVAHAFQSTRASLSDAFVAKISFDGTRLLYSSFLGGKDDDFAFGIAVDKRGRAYVAGTTTSRDFPLMRPIQGTYGGGDPQLNNVGFRGFFGDVFVTRIDSDGSRILYSTYLGGSNHDGASSIAVDGAGSAYIGGSTDSTDFPTLNALQPTNAGGGEVIVAKIALQADFAFSPISPITVQTGHSASTTVTVTSLDDFEAGVKLSVKTPVPSGIATVFTPAQLFPAQNGSASGSLGVTAGPGVAAGSYTLTVLGNDGVHSTPAIVNVQASTGSVTDVIGIDAALGCIDNSGIVQALVTKLASAQALINQGQIQSAINELTALLNQLQAQTGQHISTTCTDANGNQFNPAAVLIADVKALLASLAVK